MRLGGGVRMKGSAAFLLLLAVAGCGGSSEPSAAEKRAALAKWTQAADAACKKANDAIADRGFPVSLVDLDRLTVRAIADVQQASRTIRARKPPAGAREKVAPFVESLGELDGAMKQLSSATEDFRTAKLDEFLPEFGGTLQRVAAESKTLGLRECASHEEHIVVPDAVRAPVFAQQLADLDRRLTRRTKRLDAASTPKEAVRNLRELGAYDAELKRAARTERKAIKKLVKGIGAIPSLGGGGEAPSEDESQSA